MSDFLGANDLPHCGIVVSYYFVNIGSGTNSLLSHGIKPLPEPELTCHLRGPITSNHSPEGSLTGNSLDSNQMCLKATQMKSQAMSPRSHQVNSLWPSDTIWRHRSGSTLAQVMACCLTAPSHSPEPMLTNHHLSKSKMRRDTSRHQSLKLAWK